MNLLEYRPLIISIMKKFPKHYHGDLENEGYLSLVDAQRNYDPNKGPFEIYCKKYIYYAMIKFVSVDNLTSSLDQEISNEDGDYTTFKDLIADETDYDELITNRDYLERHMGNLTQVERFIKRKYFVDGLTVEEIIRLYSQWHGIKNIKAIYSILKLNKK